MPGYSTGGRNLLLEAAFFEQNQQLQKAFRERMEKLDRRQQLAQVSGVRDDAVLDRWVELGIGPETLAALEVVPLALVAWADGKVQPEERATIVAAAKTAGIEPRDGRYPLLEAWLKRRPSAELVDAWKQHVKALCQQLDAQEVQTLQHELLDRARQVAQAAGGILGFGDKMSAAERAVLDELEQAFA